MFVMFAVFSALTIFLFNGCSGIGLLVGCAIDPPKAKVVSENTYNGGIVQTLKQGTSIRVYKKDGTVEAGNYEGPLYLAIGTDTTNCIMIADRSSTLKEKHYIKIDEIDHVKIPGKGSKGMLIGTLSGAALDATGIVILGIIFHDFEFPDDDGTNEEE